jgi:hypothetical protein
LSEPTVGRKDRRSNGWSPSSHSTQHVKYSKPLADILQSMVGTDLFNSA